VEGFKSKNVYLLRDVGEAHAIVEASVGKNVVVVGTSFIGMETAASIVTKSKSIVCIGMEKVAFERVLGLEVGAAIQKVRISLSPSAVIVTYMPVCTFSGTRAKRYN